jgi:sugar lactone lactonase YvrE
MMLKRRASLLAVIALLAVGLASTARANEPLEVVTAFDASQGELPEGIAVDKVGNIYVSMGAPGGPSGEIRRISPDGAQTTMAELDTAAAGLAVDAQGNVYYAYVTFDPSTGGVYRLSGDGPPQRLPGTGSILLPNGLGFDKRGNLYVSDSIGGAIWRIPRNGTAELWIQHESLEGCPPVVPGFPPVGANGVAYRQGDLYVANTGQGLLVRIPIGKGGVAGAPELVAGVPECDPANDQLDSMDGIAFDAHGNIYALLVLQNKLVRIDPVTGDVTELVSGSGFHNPASLAFGTGKGDRQSLFISNFALLPPIPPDSFGPAVLKLDTGVPGMPLP